MIQFRAAFKNLDALVPILRVKESHRTWR